MKNHAFLIKVHKEPELLARIIKILAKDNHFFFVHVDAKTENYDDFVHAVDGISNIIFLQPRIPIYHTRVSMLECNLRLYKEAFSFNKKMDYFHLISGQDYPLRSNDAFDSFFENKDKSYMALDTFEFRNACMPLKYNKRVNYWWPNNNTSLFAKIYSRYYMAPISYIFKRNEIHDLWGGWEWGTLTYPVVKFILKETENNPQLLSRFNHTSCSDELYIPTVVYKHKKSLNIDVRTPLRYVSWIPKSRKNVPKGRPYILNEEDFYDVINSQAFFCRKVEFNTSQKLLDLIDQNRNTIFDFDNCDRIICAEIV